MLKHFYGVLSNVDINNNYFDNGGTTSGLCELFRAEKVSGVFNFENKNRILYNVDLSDYVKLGNNINFDIDLKSMYTENEKEMILLPCSVKE